MKTKLVLAGKSKTEIVQAIASALDKKELPALEHDVEAAVLMPPRHELASTSDVFCSGRRGELGSQSAGLAGYGGE